MIGKLPLTRAAKCARKNTPHPLGQGALGKLFRDRFAGDRWIGASGFAISIWHTRLPPSISHLCRANVGPSGWRLSEDIMHVSRDTGRRGPQVEYPRFISGLGSDMAQTSAGGMCLTSTAHSILTQAPVFGARQLLAPFQMRGVWMRRNGGKLASHRPDQHGYITAATRTSS